MSTNSNVEALLPLTPTVFHILVAIAEEPMHGYAIMQDVNERSAGRVGLGPGTLYGAIRRMVDSGLLDGAPSPSGQTEDPRRRYYRITDFGGRAMLAEAERMEQLVAEVRAKARGVST